MLTPVLWLTGCMLVVGRFTRVFNSQDGRRFYCSLVGPVCKLELCMCFTLCPQLAVHGLHLSSNLLMDHNYVLLFALVLFLSGHTPARTHGKPLPIIDDNQLLPIVDEEGEDPIRIQTYIVHVVKPEGNEFRTDRDLMEWHRSFLPDTPLQSGDPRLVYSYRHAISGFAARLTRWEATMMEAMDGFVRAVPDTKRLSLQTTYTTEFLGLNYGSSGLWSSSNYGEGIIIGVIDTGISPTHPSFKDDGMPPPPAKWKGSCGFDSSLCNNKLIGAASFCSGNQTLPTDNDGHGTHCAGVVAGSFVFSANVLRNAWGTSRGVAPKAHLAIYKVSDGGVSFASDLLAGIDQAIEDGVDVLSISLGGDYSSLAFDPVSIGSFSAMERGIFVSACAGNDVPAKSRVLNDAPWVLTVGASTTDRRIRAAVILGNGKVFTGESAFQPADANSTQQPAVYSPSCSNKAVLDQVGVKGKVVVCGDPDGNLNLGKKSRIVKAAGASAMIALNQPKDGNTTIAAVNYLPASNVNYNDGQEIYSYVNPLWSSDEDPPTSTIAFEDTRYGYRPSPAVASFSSRGPSNKNGDVPKPDVVGPGVNVMAAWPFEVGPYPTGSSTSTFNFNSGTSIAAPHLAGVAALIKRNHPTWTPAAIKSAIMTTADVVDRDGKPIADEDGDGKTAGVYEMGAGHVNPTAANDPGLVYDIEADDYIRHLCGMGFSDDDVGIITSRRIECSNFSYSKGEELNYPSIAVTLKAGKSKKTIYRTVTNVGAQKSTYVVKVKKLKGVKVSVKPKKLSFEKLDEKKSFRVRFEMDLDSERTAGGALVFQSHLSWVSEKYVVTSPIAVHYEED